MPKNEKPLFDREVKKGLLLIGVAAAIVLIVFGSGVGIGVFLKSVL